MPCATWSKPGRFGVRTVLPETRDARVDDARVARAHSVVVDAEAVLHVGPVVFDDDVGGFRQPQEDASPGLGLQVQDDAALVAVQVLEVGAEALAAHRATRVAGSLDLDHSGAPVGELAHGRRPRADTGQVEDADVFEGQLRHGGASFPVGGIIARHPQTCESLGGIGRGSALPRG